MLHQLLKLHLVHSVCQTDFNTSFSPIHRTIVVQLNLELTKT